MEIGGAPPSIPTASRFSERKVSDPQRKGMRRSGMWGWRGAAVDPIIRNCELVLREGGERDEEVGASGVAAAAMREGGGTGREDWSYAGLLRLCGLSAGNAA
jgi:hypothetical protein